MSAFERTTHRLRLRRPRSEDLAGYVALHRDPRTYAHAPESMPTVAACRERLEADVRHWATHGFGYAAVEERSSGELVGWGGAGRADLPELNLAYRLRHASLGVGLGTELARAVVEATLEGAPDRRLVAVVPPHHGASLATALGAGLSPIENHRTGSDDVVLEAPRFTGYDRLDDDQRAEVVDLWLRVNDAGGAVGFLPGAPRADVESACAAQRGVVGLLRDPAGSLLGVGFWEPGGWWGQRHVVTLKRLMVDPGLRRRGTGRLLMAGMHGLARRQSDVELWRLTYRSGLGIGHFYEGLGWVEVGRLPLGLRLAPDDRRDSVEMVRRPDGGPVVPDGRH